MEEIPNFIGMDTHLSIDDYFATSNCTNDLGSHMSDEPWKEFSDGSDSGVDSKYNVKKYYRVIYISCYFCFIICHLFLTYWRLVFCANVI